MNEQKTLSPEDAAIQERDKKIRRLEDEKSQVERKVSSLVTALNKLKGIIASTLYGAKKVVQTAMLFVTWKWFGLWITAGLFCCLLLTEIIERGYKKVLELKAEDYSW